MRNFLSAPLSNAVAILLAIVLTVAGNLAPVELAPLALSGSGTTNFTNLAVSGTTTLGGSLTLSDGNARVNDFLISDMTSALTVADGGTITPTATFQQLTAAGNVGAALSATGYTAGSVLVLYNSANVTITITDTATTKASGNMALAQFDSATLVFDGTNWIQVAESDN